MTVLNLLDLRLIASLSTFAVLYLYSRSRGSSLPLPPGPKGLPFLGNLFDMPKEFEWETYHRWAREFDSDIIYLNVAGTSIIVLDSAEAANDLLEKRSSNYSSRPRFPMIVELMGWGFNFAFLPYGELWRERRKLFHQEFHPTTTPRYYPQQMKSTHEFLRELLQTPEDFMKHIRYLTGTTIMAITYGIDLRSSDHPYIEVAEKAIHALTQAAIPGTFLVDTFPILKYVPEWFPGAGFKTAAKEWRKYTLSMAETPFHATKRNIANGVAPPSFMSCCIDKIDHSQNISYQEHIIQDTAGTMYVGGSDTIASALGTFILAIITHPEVQLRAQKELDEVLEGRRLPDFTDKPSLPYITAIVKEVFRWEIVAPLAIPHLLSVEDEYKGYRLPAGSIVIANAWSMLHNETTYPDSFSFKPERFIKDGRLDRNVKHPATAAFGFGRRICPGQYMAESSAWIAVASLLATFNITKAVDADGSVIEPSGAYTGGMINYPLPFKCSIKPRSVEAEQLIASTEFQGK